MTGQPRIATLCLDGRRLSYASWGDPASPTALLIHGMRDHCRSWDWIAGMLSARYHVVAPDLRGHGDSDWAGPDGYALPAYVADVADLAEFLELGRYAVVGHSLGGAIGLRLTAAYPERIVGFAGIECIELPINRDEASRPTAYPIRLRDWIERRQSATGRDGRHYRSIDEACARMQREQPGLSPDTVSHLARHAVVCDQGKGWRWKFDPRVRLRAPEDQHSTDLDQILDAVACPVLLAWGDNGWIPLPPAQRLGRLRHHTISHFAGGSHWLHHEFRERFTDEVRAFLHQTIGNCQYA